MCLSFQKLFTLKYIVATGEDLLAAGLDDCENIFFVFRVELIMFDPPDYPFKELTEDLFNSVADTNSDISAINKDYTEITEQIISTVESQLSLGTSDNDTIFNIANASFLDIDHNNNDSEKTELYILQSDNLLNYEPTLLDENTVNQFLLPLQVSSDTNKDKVDNDGPDLLSLHSCVICHEIFTTEADLLDHTIAFHASTDSITHDFIKSNLLPANDKQQIVQAEASDANNNLDIDSEWLVCKICERVLATALEGEPNEQLCCSNVEGSGITSRKLHTMYVCDVCNGLFADVEALDRHHLTCLIQDERYYESMQSSYPNKNDAIDCPPEVCFTCSICEGQYMSADELKTHTVECHRPPSAKDRRPFSNNGNSKMWNCGSCNQLFATARELYRHKRGEDRTVGAPVVAYVCEECDKVLGSMCALHTHKKMHKVTKPGYPCRECGRRFNQSGHLAIHMRMHTGERPYPCDLCTKAFKVKVERDDHRRTHTGERPFACSECPKTFTAAARLREHARIHTNQRPYRCDICGAAFRRPYARTVHTLIHTGEKPHECDVCGTAFRRSGDMWKHKRTLHGVQATSDSADAAKNA